MQSAVEKHLRLVHLDGLGHRRMHELPGGQQQRVALARVLVLEPAVLPLDEPLSILEAQLRVDTFPTIFETGDPLILEVDDYNPDVVYDIDSSVSFVFPKDKLIRVAQEDRLKNNNRSNASHDGIG